MSMLANPLPDMTVRDRASLGLIADWGRSEPITVTIA